MQSPTYRLIKCDLLLIFPAATAGSHPNIRHVGLPTLEAHFHLPIAAAIEGCFARALLLIFGRWGKKLAWVFVVQLLWGLRASVRATGLSCGQMALLIPWQYITFVIYSHRVYSLDLRIFPESTPSTIGFRLDFRGQADPMGNNLAHIAPVQKPIEPIARPQSQSGAIALDLGKTYPNLFVIRRIPASQIAPKRMRNRSRSNKQPIT